MKRIVIICEGETEREFCQTILSPLLLKKGIIVQAPLIKKTMGGIVNWGELKKKIVAHLKNDRTAYVTTLIDFYGIYPSHNFPNWEASKRHTNKIDRLGDIEDGMGVDIEDSIRNRYIPYIQLHEFEGLLFNDINVFREQIPADELTNISELESIFRQFQNPEMINDGRETCPSRRLERIIIGYNKIVYGNILAEAIGIDNIRRKSPRFNEWLDKIESI